MENTLSTIVENALSGLLEDVKSANKDYHTEKVSIRTKNENIAASKEVASFRINKAVKQLLDDAWLRIKKERLSNSLEEIKSILYENL